MRSSRLRLPVAMSRVAIVAPQPRLRDALVTLAAAGSVELAGALPAPEGEAAEALRRIEHDDPGSRTQEPRLLRSVPDVAALEERGERGLLAGEVELERHAATAIARGSFSTMVGWVPTNRLPSLEADLDAAGAAAVELPAPAWIEPPTLLTTTPASRPFQTIVATYGVAPYTNVDPTLFAGAAFVLMFGMMFGDVGHGLLLALLGLLLRRVRRGRLLPIRSSWPLLTISGLVAAGFGLLYGEAFGPTGIVPQLWIDPIDEPEPLLVVALAVGAVLLAVSHGYGIVNRYREAGLGAAIVAPSGAAGLGVLLGAALVVVGRAAGTASLTWLGAAVAGIAAVLLAVGFLGAAGAGPGGITQASVELVDAVVRIASNILSFARLAAFGVMHAALGLIVFTAASALWGGVVGSPLAVAIFAVGNLAAFALELLVTGVQALRLEFYELFSRIFAREGHRFSPWQMTVVSETEES